MTERDLSRVLHAHVEDVHLSDDARRAIRLAAKEEPKVKKKMNVALILLVALMMLTTAGVAANLGMFDFLAKHMGTQVLPGASSVTDLALAETDVATFTVSEAAFDGYGASVMVKVTPKDEKTFLIGEGGYMLDDLALCITGDESMGEMTILEYAKQQGYEQFVTVNAQFQNIGSDMVSVVDEWINNELIWVYGFEASGEEITLDFEGMTIPFDSKGNLDWTRDQRTAPASFTLKAAAPLWTAKAEKTIEMPEFGIRIEEASLVGTPLSTYVEVKGTVTDAAAAERVSIRVTDAQGTELRPGATLRVGTESKQDGKLVAKQDAVPMESAPDTLYLLVRDYKTNTDVYVEMPIAK